MDSDFRDTAVDPLMDSIQHFLNNEYFYFNLKDYADAPPDPAHLTDDGPDE